MKTQYTSNNEAETRQWAHNIGARLRGGEVIELVGDLGSGKTTLTRGLVAGAGSSDTVTSPTFAVSKHYAVPPQDDRSLRAVVHVDLYRLQDPGLMVHELLEDIGDPSTAVIIEWAAAVRSMLPDRRLTISFRATGEHVREIIAEYPEELNYLMGETV